MPDPITPEQIAADREIIGKATPGQWQTCGVRARIDGQPYLAVIGPKGVIAYIPYSDRTDADHVQAHVDQKIIVGSHERWPAYVDGYEILVKAIEAAPHGVDCQTVFRQMPHIGPTPPNVCNCWKSRALNGGNR